ncbi:hypothetical protein [Burkholderia pyrrocinia]|uniref:hypothetical protein n=1 Tax=Burkholderia pyrrocinia TaxID=60550 RepID=UPI0030CF647B
MDSVRHEQEQDCEFDHRGGKPIGPFIAQRLEKGWRVPGLAAKLQASEQWHGERVVEVRVRGAGWYGNRHKMKP